LKLLICDLDGTLVDSRKNITISVNAVRARHHGIAARPRFLLFGAHYTPADSEAFLEHYEQQCTHRIAFYPGLFDALQKLRASGFLLAVATNGSTRFPERILRHLGARELFDRVIGADKVGASKPAPDMLLEIFRALGHNPSPGRTWMLGDSYTDMQAADRAGISSFFAAWGYGSCTRPERILPSTSHLAARLCDPSGFSD